MNDVPSTSERRHAVVIYNPIKVDVDAMKAVVAHEEAANGWDLTVWLSTSAEDPGQGCAAKALESAASVVIVAGGDGTVRAVAEGLKDGATPMALIPSGTGNLLARNLELSLDDVPLCVHTAFTGVDRKIDLGLIEITRAGGAESSHVFLVMAGLGLDAKMLANTDDDLKKKAGWLAYVSALATTLRDKNELRFRYSLNRGPTRPTRAHTIIVANCGSLPSNIVLLPDAAVDDGQFDIALLRPEGFVGWVHIFVKIIWENGVLRRTRAGRALMTKEVSALRYVRAEELSVRLERPEQIELDGDEFGEAAGFDVRVDPGGLTIKLPRAPSQ
ncbi:diacylglycerol kinase family protein [Cryobacterium sp. PH31-O1]|uniref:diacylglycerol/lipid kinase family protein n=1 Tax=Cryobacterium sp. PH31-O1 TaxID=3046306 RepID=UPI0024B8926F|nr:diacylglycerol kinase family protein [Cryobacterium sp. PH31-O1]MDJ0339132.1 diacylglycerol kinase family protein [Cryobacterium sp. PH31-O1]